MARPELTVRFVFIPHIINLFAESTLVTKSAANRVGFSKLCIYLNVAQNLSTTVVVEAENDEETISTDGTVCTFFYAMTIFTENI